MPRTPEHRAEMHSLARARLAAGRPVWDHKIRLGAIFRNEALTFEQRRDAIVAAIKRTPWFTGKDEYDDLPQYVEELAETTNNAEFNQVWDQIYDEADYDRVWISTID